MQVPFVDLKTQYQQLKDEMASAMGEVLDSCGFILGPAVSRFESQFAQFCEVEHAVGVASGLDALILALRALDVGPGDEVIVQANTFIATALAVTATGARPVLVDCEAVHYNLDVAQIKEAITERTKVILPVHLYGQPADMNEMLSLAEEAGLFVVEDAAQAHGARYHGNRCGSMGNLGCFSFYPGKNLGAYGDGGAITTDDAQLAARLRQIRNYGSEVKYHHSQKGVNSRLDSLQAAVLGVKLNYLEDWNRSRRSAAAAYCSGLEGLDLVLPRTAEHNEHVFHLFVVQVEERDEFMRFLGEQGVSTGIHYPVPIHLQGAYAELEKPRGSFPVTEHMVDRLVSLPMFPEIEERQVDQVIKAVHDFFSAGA